MLNRRKFLTGALAAPLVVKAGVLMPVKPVLAHPFTVYDPIPYARYLEFGNPHPIIATQLERAMLEAFRLPAHIVKGARHG